MTSKTRMMAVSAVAAIGLASAGAFAQQPSNSQRTQGSSQSHQQMMRDGGGMMGMMGMMNDPEMRQQMTEMMRNCNRMMERMNNMSDAKAK